MQVLEPHSCKQVKSTSSLEFSDLINLFQGKLIALRIKKYCSESIAQKISKSLLERTSVERYLRAPDVGFERTGITFFETNGSQKTLDRYYQEALPSIQSLRRACLPHTNPIDQLRLDLDDLWLPGAIIENVHNQRMLVGIARVAKDDFELPPHQDILARDIQDATLPAIATHQDLTTQLSANIYLRCPQKGGELEIWNYKPSRVKQTEINDPKYQYEGILDRSQLPSQSLIITPEIGELILFDSGNVHGVKPCQGGPRVSMSMFVGYRDLDQPLTYWS